MEQRPTWLVAGDTIIDWVVHNGKTTPTIGGCGNLVRGLRHRGHNVHYLTLYNPALYPVPAVVHLHPEAVSDLGYVNVFLRNYDAQVFQRYRQGLRTGVFDVKGALAVVCHEKSVVRRFSAVFADVRDTSVRGTCDILRMSSSDPWQDIMKNIQWKLAVVTYNDRLHVFPSWDEPDFIMEFPPVTAVDDIGAGDAFDTGFLDWFINNAPKDRHSVYDGFRYAITVAQEKVQEVGVFLHA